MSVFHLTSRLVQAQQASAPTQHQEDESVKAGRSAELDLINALRQQGVSSEHIFRGLRVPDNFQTRRFEIDLVVLTDEGLFTIEVKNWSGRVSLGSDGQSWIHRRRSHSDNGASVSFDEPHPNLLASLQQKTQLLRQHLLRKDACLAERHFHPRLVFVNDRVELQDSLASKLEVVSPLRYPDFLLSFQKGAGWTVANAFLPSFITGENRSYVCTQVTPVSHILTEPLSQLSSGSLSQLTSGPLSQLPNESLT
jgi:Holliday junction resolvase-like predicted endonuclease